MTCMERTMHAAALLAEALETARRLDFQIREEYLEGAGGGHCTFAGRKWLLLDITQSAQEQLADALDALRGESALREEPLSPRLSELLLEVRKAA
jgi:hypothetical protein